MATSKQLSEHQAISKALEQIFSGITLLKTTFSGRLFTIDGRLVGDIGEVIARRDYKIILDDVSQPDHDGVIDSGDRLRRVQIKATFKEQLTFKTVPEYYLGLKLQQNGDYHEIFNGPGSVIYDHFEHRKGIGTELLSFPIKKLNELSQKVSPTNRIPNRPASELPHETSL
mgnify:CR=1 FL=1|jgi:hypothetical protein